MLTKHLLGVKWSVHPDGGFYLGIKIHVLLRGQKSHGNLPVGTCTCVFLRFVSPSSLGPSFPPLIYVIFFFVAVSKHKEFFFLPVPFVIRFWSISDLFPR